MLLVKNIVLYNINMRYVNTKIYLYEKKLKTIVFFGLITMSKKFLRPKNNYDLKTLGTHNVARAYKLILSKMIYMRLRLL
jgi:hypothetical protein